MAKSIDQEHELYINIQANSKTEEPISKQHEIVNINKGSEASKEESNYNYNKEEENNIILNINLNSIKSSEKNGDVPRRFSSRSGKNGNKSNKNLENLRKGEEDINLNINNNPSSSINKNNNLNVKAVENLANQNNSNSKIEKDKHEIEINLEATKKKVPQGNQDDIVNYEEYLKKTAVPITANSTFRKESVKSYNLPLKPNEANEAFEIHEAVSKIQKHIETEGSVGKAFTSESEHNLEQKRIENKVVNFEENWSIVKESSSEFKKRLKVKDDKTIDSNKKENIDKENFFNLKSNLITHDFAAIISSPMKSRIKPTVEEAIVSQKIKFSEKLKLLENSLNSKQTNSSASLYNRGIINNKSNEQTQNVTQPIRTLKTKKQKDNNDDNSDFQFFIESRINNLKEIVQRNSDHLLREHFKLRIEESNKEKELDLSPKNEKEDKNNKIWKDNLSSPQSQPNNKISKDNLSSPQAQPNKFIYAQKTKEGSIEHLLNKFKTDKNKQKTFVGKSEHNIKSNYNPNMLEDPVFKHAIYHTNINVQKYKSKLDIYSKSINSFDTLLVSNLATTTKRNNDLQNVFLGQDKNVTKKNKYFILF